MREPDRQEKIVFSRDLPYLVHQRAVEDTMRTLCGGKKCQKNLSTLVTRLVEGTLAEAIERAFQSRPSDGDILHGVTLQRFLTCSFNGNVMELKAGKVKAGKVKAGKAGVGVEQRRLSPPPPPSHPHLKKKKKKKSEVDQKTCQAVGRVETVGPRSQSSVPHV